MSPEVWPGQKLSAQHCVQMGSQAQQPLGEQQAEPVPAHRVPHESSTHLAATATILQRELKGGS